MRRLVVASLVLALSCAAVSAQQGVPPDVSPPPPPPETFVPVTETEVLGQLPAREREMVQKEDDPKDRFDAWLDVSDLRLADAGAKLDGGSASVAEALLLYDSVLRVADQVLRSPEARAKPRDKHYKRFERRLNKQLSVLTPLVSELSVADTPTGEAVLETVKRLRTEALNSALGVDILSNP